MNVLAGRVAALENEKLHKNSNDLRRSQLGSGMRGDKIRTYRTQDDQVTDHRDGKRWSLKRWMKGEW